MLVKYKNYLQLEKDPFKNLLREMFRQQLKFLLVGIQTFGAKMQLERVWHQ